MHIIEQAMAFGVLSYWKGCESMGRVLSKDLYSACEVSGVPLAYSCVHAAQYGYAQAYLWVHRISKISIPYNHRSNIQNLARILIGANRIQNRAFQQPITTSPNNHQHITTFALRKCYPL